MLSTKVKHATFSPLEKGEKAVNIVSEFEISKQQVSDILKNRENVKGFADNFKTSSGLKGSH